MLDGPLPTADAAPTESDFFSYAVVFDADGSSSNNFQHVAPCDWDHYRGTDRWYEASFDPFSGEWTVTVRERKEYAGFQGFADGDPWNVARRAV